MWYVASRNDCNRRFQKSFNIASDVREKKKLGDQQVREREGHSRPLNSLKELLEEESLGLRDDLAQTDNTVEEVRSVILRLRDRREGCSYTPERNSTDQCGRMSKNIDTTPTSSFSQMGSAAVFG